MLERLIGASIAAIGASLCGMTIAVIYLLADMPDEARIITSLGAFAGAAAGIYLSISERM